MLLDESCVLSIKERMKRNLLLLCIVLNSLACSSKGDPQKSIETRYKNPVLNFSLPDPTIIRADDKSFYLYATEDIRNLPIYKSTDLINWKFVGTAFTDNTRPNFESGGGIWAPDINRINGIYVMYYSMSVWGGEWTCGIGIATANTPDGPFMDRGMLFRSNTINVQNSIDPFYIEDGGRKYLFWGSFHGIYGIELAEDGLSVKSGAEKKQVAGTAYEGTYIHKKDGYYYLFASTGTCCEGLNSTYQTVVGRSENLWGPYVDKNGQEMLNNYHEVLIHKNSAFVGTGHNSEIVSDDAGQSWVFYHGVDKKNPEGRILLLDKVNWINGWPSVNTDSPSLDSERPLFNNNKD
jgi:arabinan endo-1,5-alpha-L-arabinosidase